MMRLSTMWKVHCAPDGAERGSLAEQILKDWQYDRGSVRPFRSSATFVYVFRGEGERRFLRFAEHSERSREAIEAEVYVVNWLAQTGLNVARPIASRSGDFVATTVTELGAFHAVVFAALEGAQFDIGDLDRAPFRAWGAALGELHAALRAYPGPGLSARDTWEDHLNLARRYVPLGERAIRSELDRIAAALGVLPVRRDNFGLIHFDFELDNLCWRDHAVGMLDFDDCAHYWYAADIAFALGDSAFREFVRGYAAQQPIEEEMLAAIPLFLRMAELTRFARLARAMDLPDGQAYPDWLAALSRKLAKRMAAYRASLEGQTS